MDTLKIFLRLLILLQCFAISSCKEVIDKKIVFETATLKDSLSFYFPNILSDSVKRKYPDYENFTQNWYSSALYSFKEPILYTKTDSATIYRVLWLRSFHEPVCFSVKAFHGYHFINVKVLDRQPAFYPYIEISEFDEETGKEIPDTVQKADRFAVINFSLTKQISNRQWEKIEKQVSDINFWNSPSLNPFVDDSADGSNWIMEGRKNGKYHFLDRRNGQSNIKVLGKHLIKLSGLKIRDNVIY